MSNLLKMHLFRARRGKLTWILLIVLVAFLVVQYGAMYLMRDLLSTSAMEELSGLSSTPMPNTTNFFDNVIVMFQAQFIPMVLSIFILLFLGIDRSSGFIKNIVSYLDNKYSVAGASLLLCLIYQSVLVLVTLGISLGSCYLIYDNVSFANAGGFFKFLAVFYLSTLSFTMLLVMLADLSGKHVLMMILGVLFLAFGTLLYQLIDLLVAYLRDGDCSFVIEKYLPPGGLQTLSATSPTEAFLRIGGLGAVVLVGAFLLDVVALKKQDIQ